MPKIALLLIPLTLLAAGCGSSIEDSSLPGSIDSDVYQDAVFSNKQRLAGEDHPLHESLVSTPFDFIGEGYDTVIAKPITHWWDTFNHDTPAVARIKMLDPLSADNRREGTLRLSDFDFTRTDPHSDQYLILYAKFIAVDADYTVRAAGIRALNRCRAKGYTNLFIKALSDDSMLVRLEAAKALANIPDPAAIPALLRNLNGLNNLTGAKGDVSKDVRIACADALRNFKTIEVANVLIAVLEDRDFSVAWQARQSLELLTGQDFRYDEKAWLAYLSHGKAFL